MENTKLVFGHCAWKLPPPKTLANILDAAEAFFATTIVYVNAASFLSPKHSGIASLACGIGIALSKAAKKLVGVQTTTP
jgi:hypothetical protein